MYAQKTPTAARAVRMDKKTREAQARLADKSFSSFMREHNARSAKPFEPNPKAV